MSLNIKNQRVHDLARRAAEQSGLSQTSAMEAALVQYLDGMATPGAAVARRQRVAALLEDIDARMTPEMREQLSADDLYDADGLPA